jgi:hypothetical protein
MDSNPWALDPITTPCYQRLSFLFSFQNLLKLEEPMTLSMESPRQILPPAAQRQLRTAQDLFIRRWGEMGQTWGINRTMAEIHALLYVVAEPLCTVM